VYQVGIVFKNRSKATFDAKEFDVDLSRGAIEGSYTATQKFSYKATNEEETPIYLNPSEVAGIVVAPAQETVDRSLQLS
jgi:hypothetical protein